MHNLSQHKSNEPEPETEPDHKDIDILMAIEYDENEPLGNMFKDRLADPRARTMDYTKNCILLSNEAVPRQECKRHELLAYLARDYQKKNPQAYEKGLPGQDLIQFLRFPPECRACILYRCAPGSWENYRSAEAEVKATTNRSLWGLGGLAGVGLWTYAIGTHIAEVNPLVSALLATVLGSLTFLAIRGKIPRFHAHGPREANSSSREGLRSRAEQAPEDHEGIRFREVDANPSPSSTPAGASIEGKAAEPTVTAAPQVTTGGNPGLLAPELRRENPVPAKGPGPDNTEIVVPARYEEPKAAVLPVKAETPAPAAVDVPTPPGPGIPPKSPRQPSKKAPAKAKGKVKKDKEPEAPAPAPAVQGFPCDHPGCGKVCKTNQALKSHKLTHARAEGKTTN